MRSTHQKTFCLLVTTLFLASLITCGQVPLVHAQVTTRKIEYTIEAGPYNITKDEQGFDRIVMPGYETIESPGDPVLPQKILEFWVPQDIIWSSANLTVDIQLSEELPESYNIRPCPPRSIVAIANELPYDPEYEDWGVEKSIVNGSNMYVYGRDANYPENPVEMAPYTQRKEPAIIIEAAGVTEADQGFEENSYLRLAYRPFLYNPVQHKLTLINKALVIIIYDVPVIASIDQATPTGDSTSYDYVIITTNYIESHSQELAYFIHLKELYGHSVKVVTEDDFMGLTGQLPNGRAEKIRQWLINNYQTLGINYVLLVGNPDPDDPLDTSDSVGDVPMKMCYHNYFGQVYRESPTDYFYADLTGNWDLDGDQVFAEGLESNHIVSPDPAIGPDTFSARWTGKVMFDFTDTYQLHTYSDEGVRLYIDGSLVIDDWVSHLPKSDYASLAVTAGKHDITLDFREDTGDSIIQLLWSCSSEGQPHFVKHDIIPGGHLYDASDSVGGLTGTYYDNVDFTGTSITRKDNTINFIWGTGDKGAGGPEAGAEVFVGRIPVYNNDFAQLDKILEKTIKYETDPGNIDWRKTILLPMEPLWADTPSYQLGEGIRNNFALAAGFTCYRIYDNNYNPPTPELWPCNLNNVLNEWKNGYGMVTWCTHGSQTFAADVFDISLTHDLDNSKPSFTFQASCLTGCPERNNNLGYSLLKEGAIATVSASRVSWEWHEGPIWPWVFDPQDCANHNLAYYYTKKVVQEGKPAGVALYLTKGNMPSVIDLNEMDYNLYGDPDCYLLTVIPNNPATAEAGGPYVQDEGKPIIFDASGSTDPDGNALQYRWDFENDGIWDTSWSTDPKAQHTWGDDYIGTAKVEVSDGLVTTTDTASVHVLNVPPTATIDALIQPNPQFILPMVHTLTFKGSFTDPGWLDTHTAKWNFGDGTIVSGAVVEENIPPDATGTTSASHIYSNPGTYTVTLTVTDDDGGVGTSTIQVVVVGAEEAKDDINKYIQNLPNAAFKNNPNQRKKALDNEFAAIDKMIQDKDYQEAIDDLQYNIRAKADGIVGAESAIDWIIDPTAQKEICMKIDDLIAYLRTFL